MSCRVTCRECDGVGRVREQFASHSYACERCDGEGTLEADNCDCSLCQQVAEDIAETIEPFKETADILRNEVFRLALALAELRALLSSGECDTNVRTLALARIERAVLGLDSLRLPGTARGVA